MNKNIAKIVNVIAYIVLLVILFGSVIPALISAPSNFSVLLGVIVAIIAIAMAYPVYKISTAKKD